MRQDHNKDERQTPRRPSDARKSVRNFLEKIPKVPSHHCHSSCSKLHLKPIVTPLGIRIGWQKGMGLPYNVNHDTIKLIVRVVCLYSAGGMFVSHNVMSFNEIWRKHTHTNLPQSTQKPGKTLIVYRILCKYIILVWLTCRTPAIGGLIVCE